jgi:hypothetical protein
MYWNGGSSRSIFFGSARIDRERMDIGLHQIAERGVHGAMARQRCLAIKRCAHDAHAEVASSVTSAGVTGMAMALVLDHEFKRHERSGQACPDLLDPIAQGSTLRNGRTLTPR